MSGKDFETASSYVTKRIEEKLKALSEDIKNSIWEIRLRTNCPVCLINSSGCNFLYPSGRVSLIYNTGAVTADENDLRDTFNRLCEYSVHANIKDVVNGFVSLSGGHRAGICGSAVCDKNNNIISVKDISAINIRIATEHIGVADEIYNEFFSDNIKSVIIGGPPSSGKTTVLRDLARQLSGPQRGFFYRTCIADERGEIAAVHHGRAQKNIGFCDVLDGYPKEKGINIALRTMAPQIVVCDEISTMEEVNRVKEGLNTGVKFIVSVHMEKKEDIFLKPILKELIKGGEFSNLVLLKGGNSPSKVKGIYSIEELNNESIRNDCCDSRICTLGQSSFAESYNEKDEASKNFCYDFGY